MLSDEEVMDKTYKKAVVSIAKDLPQLIKAMNELSREIRLMPRSVRLRH